MRRLMLLRHAKTETDAPSGRDQDRRLDDRGHKDAGEIGDWMASHPPFPEAVLVSHAVRARQTWDIAWETMKDRVAAPQVEVLPELYAAEPPRSWNPFALQPFRLIRGNCCWSATIRACTRSP